MRGKEKNQHAHTHSIEGQGLSGKGKRGLELDNISEQQVRATQACL